MKKIYGLLGTCLSYSILLGCASGDNNSGDKVSPENRAVKSLVDVEKQNKLEELETKTSKLTKDLQAKQKELTDAKSLLEAEIARLTSELEKNKQDIQAKDAELQKNVADLASTRSQLKIAISQGSKECLDSDHVGQIKTLTEEKGILEQQLKSKEEELTKQIATLTTQIEAAQTLQDQLTEKEKARSEAEKNLTKAQAEIDKLNGEIEGLKKKKQDQGTQTGVSLEQVKKELTATKQQLEEKARKKAQEDLKEKESEHATKVQELNKKIADLEKQQKQSTQEVKQLTAKGKEVDKLTKEKNELGVQLTTANQKVEKLTKEKATLLTKQTELNRQIEESRKKLEATEKELARLKQHPSEGTGATAPNQMEEKEEEGKKLEKSEEEVKKILERINAEVDNSIVIPDEMRNTTSTGIRQIREGSWDREKKKYEQIDIDNDFTSEEKDIIYMARHIIDDCVVLCSKTQYKKSKNYLCVSVDGDNNKIDSLEHYLAIKERVKNTLPLSQVLMSAARSFADREASKTMIYGRNIIKCAFFILAKKFVIKNPKLFCEEIFQFFEKNNFWEISSKAKLGNTESNRYASLEPMISFVDSLVYDNFIKGNTVKVLTTAFACTLDITVPKKKKDQKPLT